MASATMEIHRSIKAWASSLDAEVSEAHYASLAPIPSSMSFGALPQDLLLKYSLMYTAKAHALWNYTTLAGLCDFLAHLLELDPLYTTQHTIEEALEMLFTPHEHWHEDLYWEAWLRRLPMHEVSISFHPANWWLYRTHPVLERSFKDFLIYFDHLEEGNRQRFLAQYPEQKNLMIRFDQLMHRNSGFDFVNSSNKLLKNWIRQSYDRLVTHVINASYYKNIFVKPNFHEQTLRQKQLMNLSAVCCVIRKFLQPNQDFVQDVLLLQAPFLVQRLEQMKLWPYPHNTLDLEYYLVEQTALALHWTLFYYFNDPLLQPFRQQLFVVPRTSTTCYLVGTHDALRALRYGQLNNMDMTIPRDPKIRLRRRHQYFLMESPPTFPVLIRTWNECVDMTHHQPTSIQVIGLRQVLLTMVRNCYLAGGKILANTWYKDVTVNTRQAAAYSRWEWNEEALAQGLYSTAVPAQFIDFYQRFFILLQKGWNSPFAVRRALVEAKLNQPGMDDYQAPQGSIFTFVESYVFVRAPHAIHQDIVSWLDTQVIRDFPAGVRLVNTLGRIKASQDAKTASLFSISSREREWREKWIILDPAIVPRTDLLLDTYYLLCHLPQWTEQEARTLLLSCRLAPGSPLLDEMPNSPMDEEESMVDQDDENSFSSSSRSQAEAPSEWSLENLDQILNFIESDADENTASIDVSSAADDYDSEDNFSCSSMDEEGGFAPPPNLQLTTGVKMRKRKRSSSKASEGGNGEQKIYKKQRRHSASRLHDAAAAKPEQVKDEEEGEEEHDQEEKMTNSESTKFQQWNYFNTIVTRREVLVRNLDGPTTDTFIQAAPQPLLPWQLQFFAALEDMVHNRNVSLDEAVIARSVELSQSFLYTLANRGNTYTIYFGRDNLDKITNIKSTWFDSQHYMQTIWTKIAQIKSYAIQKLAQESLAKLGCRYYFDHEVICIPAIIDRIISRYGAHSHQRQFLELTFEAVPRFMAPPHLAALQTLQEQMKQRAAMDRILMPPPPQPMMLEVMQPQQHQQQQEKKRKKAKPIKTIKIVEYIPPI